MPETRLSPRQGWAIDLRTMVDSVSICSADSYRLLGELATRSQSETLTDALAKKLYSKLYTRRQETSSTQRRLTLDAIQAFQARLQAVGVDRTFWQAGWNLAAIDQQGICTVERDGMRYRSLRRDVRNEHGPLQVGAEVALRVPGNAPDLMPGFHTLLRGRDSGTRGSTWVVRLYWNLTSEVATRWLSETSSQLDKLGIPFTAKVLDDPRAYGRADAGVLYLAPNSWREAMPGVVRIYHHLQHALCRPTPLFTLPLAPGLAVAEGPSDGQSFGEHRCRLIAGALVDAFEHGMAVDSAVDAAFQQAGLDPAKPYRAPGSQSLYRLCGLRTSWRMRALPRRLQSEDFSEIALQIGLDLCTQANWHDGRCSWLGPSPLRTLGVKSRRAADSTLPPELYSGTSGVAFFLTELFATSHDTRLLDTVQGALSQAQWQVDHEILGIGTLGLYQGLLGHLWALRHSARRLGNGDLLNWVDQRLTALLEEAFDTPEPNRCIDLMHGDSGTIAALVDLYRTTGSPDLRLAALALGDRLYSHAEASDGCWTWPGHYGATRYDDGPPQLGLSHGNAGVGLALLNLFQVTGEPRLLEAARGAFAYEDRLFDTIHGNWPDLRAVSESRHLLSESAGVPTRFMTAWCHGAAGIALSRLRAAQLDPGAADQYLPAAWSGMKTTIETLRVRLHLPNRNTSLCHGLCGLIDAALEAADVLGEKPFRHVAHGALRSLARRYAVDGNWPSGLSRHPWAPGLMLGSSGVGYTFLRATHPDLRSILVF